MTILLVMIGGAVGAPLRYLTDRFVQNRQHSKFPWGTFTANMAGSFILGFLIQGAVLGHVSGNVSSLLGTGLCGALTTYSTFGYETVRLFQDKFHAYAVLNVVGSIAAGLGAAFCGITIADAIWM
ncbi:fluoride efflux transporter CrcB [Actinoplanes solisilvae]|uniref:fluoride efflux transporter CrcB n=1 Tax=Actinoplanes solisilvae TaxID=2486853 RepID=UPI000FDCC315|nr:fluoride efflux transporter CrcB [Actinoplanes solisilvae]